MTSKKNRSYISELHQKFNDTSSLTVDKIKSVHPDYGTGKNIMQTLLTDLRKAGYKNDDGTYSLPSLDADDSAPVVEEKKTKKTVEESKVPTNDSQKISQQKIEKHVCLLYTSDAADE